MPSSTHMRWRTGSATAAGVAWTLLGLLSLATPDPARYLDALILPPLALTIGGISAVYLTERAQLGRLGRLNYLLSITGLATLLAGQSFHLAEMERTRDLLTIPGMAAFVIGFALFGIATARARVLPTWTGVVIALAQPLTVLIGVALSPISPLSNYGNYTGALAHGIIWLALGATLRKRAIATNRQSATARATA